MLPAPPSIASWAPIVLVKNIGDGSQEWRVSLDPTLPWHTGVHRDWRRCQARSPMPTRDGVQLFKREESRPLPFRVLLSLACAAPAAVLQVIIGDLKRMTVAALPAEFC